MNKPREFWINCPQDSCGKWTQDRPEDYERLEFVTSEPFNIEVIEKSAYTELEINYKQALDNYKQALKEFRGAK